MCWDAKKEQFLLNREYYQSLYTKIYQHFNPNILTGTAFFAFIQSAFLYKYFCQTNLMEEVISFYNSFNALLDLDAAKP